ncbi:Hypothetical protein SMAX5B_000671 [Scophthalmus maximus]|uniref:Uncharacterized protein n=1 Tax=Scophthalmus maximus TaxID=52904 RepID=A0A2U9B6E7_SCOMX|nr:Hypothetical protein SMAX5B_000671 [Scophthalmus maximus]KAF0030850.1 hypothetical protein F2P81_017581 [Scophthalmus maximus]
MLQQVLDSNGRCSRSAYVTASLTKLTGQRGQTRDCDSARPTKHIFPSDSPPLFHSFSISHANLSFDSSSLPPALTHFPPRPLQPSVRPSAVAGVDPQPTSGCGNKDVVREERPGETSKNHCTTVSSSFFRGFWERSQHTNHTNASTRV